MYFKNCYRPADPKPEAGGVFQYTGSCFDVRKFGRLAGELFPLQKCVRTTYYSGIQSNVVCGKTRMRQSLLVAGFGVSAVTDLLFNWERNFSVCTLCIKVSWAQLRRF